MLNDLHLQKRHSQAYTILSQCNPLLHQSVVWRKKSLEKGTKSKLCIFKIHLVLVATVHKIILLPIEISSSLADSVT